MRKKEYSKIFELEENHWWFFGKRKVIFSLLKKYIGKEESADILKNQNDIKLLDIGCGTGIILKEFSKYGTAYGVDFSDYAINFCKKRGLKNVSKGNANNLKFKKNSFDVVGIFDVLYHKEIKDDEKVMRDIWRILKPGGIIILTDSANMSLWSRHDVMVHARHRYTTNEIRDKLQKAQFTVEKLSYYNFFLFPLVYLVRKFDNRFNKNKEPKSNVGKTSNIINIILKEVFSLEAFLLRFIKFPFGVSVVCIARKPDNKKL